MSHYISGCGIGSTISSNIYNAITGREMPNKVFEAYTHICRAYQSHRDEIYLIGFSRGAHVAKCVAHFILNFGVLQGVPEDKAREYFEQWLKRLQNPGDNSTVQVRAQHEAFLFKDVRIRACALFDTVDTMFASNDALKAVDHRLSSNIDHAIQALALSEHRDLFRQVSWYQEELLRDNTSTRLQQCWFNGCHLHVGGGGDQDYISLVPLFWVASQLHELGLDFDHAKLTKNPELVKVLPNPGQRPMARRFSTLGSQVSEAGQKIMGTVARLGDSANDLRYWLWSAAHRTPGRRFVRQANGVFKETTNNIALSSETIHWTVRCFDKKNILPIPVSMDQASYYQHEDGGWAWRIPPSNASGTSAVASNVREAPYSDLEVMLLHQCYSRPYPSMKQRHLDGQKLGPQDTLVRHTIAALNPIVKRLVQEPDKVAVLGQALADYTKKNIRKERSKHKERQRRVKNKVNWQTP